MDAAVAAVKAKVTPELVANVGQVYIFEIGHAVSSLIGALVHSPTHFTWVEVNVSLVSQLVNPFTKNINKYK